MTINKTVLVSPEQINDGNYSDNCRKSCQYSNQLCDGHDRKAATPVAACQDTTTVLGTINTCYASSMCNMENENERKDNYHDAFEISDCDKLEIFHVLRQHQNRVVIHEPDKKYMSWTWQFFIFLCGISAFMCR